MVGEDRKSKSALPSVKNLHGIVRLILSLWIGEIEVLLIYSHCEGKVSQHYVPCSYNITLSLLRLEELQTVEYWNILNIVQTTESFILNRFDWLMIN